MKKIIAILILLFIVQLFGQDKTVSFKTVYQDTLQSGIDTVRFNPSDKYAAITITAVTDTLGDTLYVDALSKTVKIDDTTNIYYWTPRALKDLSADTTVTKIIATTSAKEYLIIDPQIWWFRLRTKDAKPTRYLIQARY